MENTANPNWSRFHLAAAGLTAFTFALHLIGGTPEINAPVRASDFEPALRSILSVVWHMITLTLLVMASATLWLAKHRNPPLYWMVLSLNLGYVALFLGYGIYDLGSIFVLPQWTLFAAISLCLLIGQWRRS